MVGVGDGGWGGSPQRADECRPASGGSLGGMCRTGPRVRRSPGHRPAPVAPRRARKPLPGPLQSGAFEEEREGDRWLERGVPGRG